MGRSESGKTESAWNALFDKYDIADRVGRDGSFSISAEQIKEFREPRLMAKFDHRKNLPSAFRESGLGILPVSRGDYLIGPFDLFAPLPDPNSDVVAERASLPHGVESVTPATITSEPVALNCAWDSGILHRFLGEDRLFPTLSGRMGANPFSFRIGSPGGGGESVVAVDGAQIEVDAAYEGERSLTLLEAKMDLAEDFIVRQLYYPFRHFSSLPVSKPVRTVFLTYSGGVFDLAEYGFDDPDCYSSVRLLRSARYSLETAVVTRADLERLLDSTRAEPEPDGIPFPQADTFARVVNLCERLSSGPMSKEDIEEAYGFDPRQADYYYNAAAYLGLARLEAGRGSRVVLADAGRRFASLPLSRRNPFLAELILKHEAFRRTLRIGLERGSAPGKPEIRGILLETNPGLGDPACDTFGRRASTVRHWIQWLLSIADHSR